MRTYLIPAVALVLATGPALAADTGPVVPQFVEETKSAGIDSVYAGEWQYMVGGGAATFDCNDDGYADMLLAGGEKPATFYRNTSSLGGALHFAAQKSGLEFDKVTGAYPLDMDGDGKQDIVLLRVGENLVMRGKGGCQFEQANKDWGFDGGDGWSTAFAATFEKGAHWPTLAIGNYVDRAQEAFPWGSCTDNWLHRPDADQRKFAQPVALKPSFCALSMLFTDWNKSGTPSLRVSNDREYYKGGQEQLWHVEPGKEPALYTEAEGWKNLRIWGMGIASYDLNFDGYPEYFLTSMADNKLQSLATLPEAGKPAMATFSDIAFAKGVTAHRPYTGGDWHPSTAWHAQFEDVNNDGLVDLFVAKGNVAEMPDFAAKDPNNLLLQGADGKFVESGDKAGIASMAISRGGAVTDFNLDGLPDLVVVNRWQSAQLWRNSGPSAGHWLAVSLQRDDANRDGIGAWIEVKRGDIVMRREITSGGGQASGHNGWWHIGLGDQEKAEIRVVWPDGTAGAWEKLDADRFYRISPDHAAVMWSPEKTASAH
jgi:enediyne biosynthesis protein E4